jgi:hypothetical protein
MLVFVPVGAFPAMEHLARTPRKKSPSARQALLELELGGTAESPYFAMRLRMFWASRSNSSGPGLMPAVAASSRRAIIGTVL